MSQHDMNLANGPGAAFRSDLNGAIGALVSQSSGATAPNPTFPCQIWADTGTGRTRQRDMANTIWIDKGPLEGALAPLDSPLFTGKPTGSLPSIIGGIRNAKISITAASANCTFTADEIIVKAGLGGLVYTLASFNKSVNLATTGAGGMDTGAAPVSGFVALYAIYSPTTGTSALLAKNATSAIQAEVYGGASMPSGYTASALISVWPTNSSGQLKVGAQADRAVAFPAAIVLSTSTAQASPTSLSVAGTIPFNARSINGYAQVANAFSGNSVVVMNIAADSALSGASSFGLNLASSTGSQNVSNFACQIATPQTIFYSLTALPGAPGACAIYISGYTI